MAAIRDRLPASRKFPADCEEAHILLNDVPLSKSLVSACGVLCLVVGRLIRRLLLALGLLASGLSISLDEDVDRGVVWFRVLLENYF